MSSQKKQGRIIERLLNVVHFEIKQPVNYGQAIYIEFLNLQDKRQPLRMECEDEEYWFYRTKLSPTSSLDEKLHYQYFIADYFDSNSNRTEILFKYDTSFPKKLIPNNFTVVHDKPWMNAFDRLDVTPEKNLMYFSLEYLKAINYGEAIYVMWFSPNEGERLSFTEDDIKRSQRLLWNRGHSWQGTVVIKKEFFIQNKGQLLFPFVKSYYYKRMVSEFQSILQDQNGNKKTINIYEDKDITERAVFEGKDSSIKIELNDLENIDQLKQVEIEGVGQFEVLYDEKTGKYSLELLADREFFENDNNKLKINLYNQKKQVNTVQERQQGHATPIQDHQQGNSSSNQEPQQGHVSSIQDPQQGHATSIQDPQQSNSSSIQVPQQGHVSSIQDPQQGHATSIQDPQQGNVSQIQVPQQQGHVSSVGSVQEPQQNHVSLVVTVQKPQQGQVSKINITTQGSQISSVKEEFLQKAEQYNQISTSESLSNSSDGEEFPQARSRQSNNDWKNYWNPYTGNIKPIQTEQYIKQLASQYSKYNMQEKQVRPPIQNFKIHQAVNHKIYHNLSNPLFERKVELKRLVDNINQSFVDLTNFSEFQDYGCERLTNPQQTFPTKKYVQQYHQNISNIKQQYVEVQRQFKSRTIIEEKDSLKDSQIRIIENIPSIKEKMTKLETLQQEQEKNYKLSQKEILEEEKLSLVVMAKKWGLVVMGKIIGVTYQELCTQIFAIVDKVLQTQYSESQLIKACLSINETCNKSECQNVEHRGCQGSMQNQINVDFRQYIQNLMNQKTDEYIFQQLKSLVLDSFDCYIDYGKNQNLQLNYKNEHEKSLLITLVNYSVLYACANKYNNKFPQFTTCGCAELGPFCQETSTQFTYENLCKLQNIYSQKFETRQFQQTDIKNQIVNMQQQVKQEIETCIRGEGHLQNRELLDLVYINSDISDLIESDAPVFYQLTIDALDENEKKISIIEMEQDEQKQQDELKELLSEKNRDKIKAFLF